jgi:hypothetical protein
MCDRRSSSGSVLLVTLLTLVFLGCSNSEAPQRIGRPGPDRSSPEAVLLSLRDAYLNREADDYASLLADGFEFYFSPEDQQIAQKLLRSEEVEVHQSMFASPSVDQIGLEFTLSEPFLDQSKPDPKRAGDYLWSIYMDDLDLALRMRDNQGKSLTYRAGDSLQQFWFRQQPSGVLGSGELVWVIAEWRELGDPAPPPKGGTRGASLRRKMSWGEVKLLF